MANRAFEAATLLLLIAVAISEQQQQPQQLDAFSFIKNFLRFPRLSSPSVSASNQNATVTTTLRPSTRVPAKLNGTMPKAPVLHSSTTTAADTMLSGTLGTTKPTLTSKKITTSTTTTFGSAYTKKIDEIPAKSTTLQYLSSSSQNQSPTTFRHLTTPSAIKVPTTPLNATIVTTLQYADTATTPVDDLDITTEEPRDNHQRIHDYYVNKREKPQVKITANFSQNLLPLPAAAGAVLVKPTKYHYYPHNQHIYLLPECAIQQVCSAVYVRFNWTQPLCACPSRYGDPCSASTNSDDMHTTELATDRKSTALTLVKTCESITEMRVCRPTRDWSLLALQNIRTGKSHYLVICRCPGSSTLEGPISHDQPTYASVPGIRVYGMMCVDTKRIKGRPKGPKVRESRHIQHPFPWDRAVKLAKAVYWDLNE